MDVHGHTLPFFASAVGAEKVGIEHGVVKKRARFAGSLLCAVPVTCRWWDIAQWIPITLKVGALFGVRSSKVWHWGAEETGARQQPDQAHQQTRETRQEGGGQGS